MASAEEHAEIHIVLDNASETNPSKPWQRSTRVISSGAKASPTGESYKAIPFTGNFPFAGKRIILKANSEASDTVESEESQAEIPVLLLDELNGNLLGERILSFETMTGFTSADTVDVALTANVPQRLAYQDAPQGQIFALNPNQKVRVYLGDDTV